MTNEQIIFLDKEILFIKKMTIINNIKNYLSIIKGGIKPEMFSVKVPQIFYAYHVIIAINSLRL